MSRNLPCLTDAPVGSIISFDYYGGTYPDTRRNVEVKEVNTCNRNIGGIDRAIDSFRTFSDNQATGVVLVTEAPKAAVRTTTVSVHFVQARQQLVNKINTLHGDMLASIYTTIMGGSNPHFNDKSASVEYDVPVKTVSVNGMELTKEDLQKLLASVE